MRTSPSPITKALAAQADYASSGNVTLHPMNRRTFMRAASGLLIPAMAGQLVRAQARVSGGTKISGGGRVYRVAGGGGGGGVGDVLFEDFEGAGYHETVSGSWSETIGTNGIVNEDNGTGALLGSQDLLIYGGDAGQVSYTQFDTGSAKNEVFFRVRLQIDALPSIDLVPIMFRDAADISRLVVYLRPSGLVKIECGGGTGNTIATYSAGTAYYIWVHFKNDGTGSVAFSTTSTEPTSGNFYVPYAGGDTVALQTLRLRSEDQKTIHFDDVIWNSTTIP